MRRQTSAKLGRRSNIRSTNLETARTICVHLRASAAKFLACFLPQQVQQVCSGLPWTNVAGLPPSTPAPLRQAPPRHARKRGDPGTRLLARTGMASRRTNPQRDHRARRNTPAAQTCHSLPSTHSKKPFDSKCTGVTACYGASWSSPCYPTPALHQRVPPVVFAPTSGLMLPARASDIHCLTIKTDSCAMRHYSSRLRSREGCQR